MGSIWAFRASPTAADGVWIDPRREDYDYGRFAWIRDPDGNRIELWEPPKITHKAVV